MAEWIEVTAPSVDAARDRALDLLGITVDEIEVEVVAEPSKQLFGLRRTDARIRARVLPRTPPPKDDGRRRRSNRNGQKGRKDRGGRNGRTRENARAGDGRGRSEPAAETGDRTDRPSSSEGGGRPRRRSRRGGGRRSGSGPRDAESGASAAGRGGSDPGGDASAAAAGGRAARPEPTRRRRADGVRQINRRVGADTPTDQTAAQEAQMDSDATAYQEQAETVGDFLDGVLETFGLDGEVVVGTVEDEEVEVDLRGEDLGLLIGPRGQTMTALHELAKTVLQRTAPNGPRVRLRLDVAGYRQKRREALSQFVRTQAAEVVASGQARALEPMNAADRKVVHDTINEIDGIITESEGEEPRRRVVLVPA